jgi:predicted nucleic acid-binding protein
MTPKLDFGDAMIVAAMQESGVSIVYSYDAHFDRIAGIVRQQPR